MKPFMKLITFCCASCLLALTACAEDTVYRNLYEGVKPRELSATQPIPATPREPQMPYDQYKAERDKLQETDTAKSRDPVY